MIGLSEVLVMDAISHFLTLLTKADPFALVTLVCVVALLVVAECVRQFCKVLGKRKDD